jgi:hypothetical protein
LISYVGSPTRGVEQVEHLTLRLAPTFLFISAFLFLAFPPGLAGQQQSEPKSFRFDFTPFVGYRTSMTLPIEPHVAGTNPRVIIDASPSYGASFGMRPREEDVVEVRWARQDSSIHAEDITPLPPRQRTVLDQFHGDFSHEPFIEEWPAWAKPFVLASVGATHVSAGSNLRFTRFSFGIGGGIRLYASRHLGFKVQAEWLPVFADPQIAFICGAGCIIHVAGTVSSQGEIVLAPFLRF